MNESQLDWKFIKNKYGDQVKELCRQIEDDVEVAKKVTPGKYQRAYQNAQQSAEELRQTFEKGCE